MLAARLTLALVLTAAMAVLLAAVMAATLALLLAAMSLLPLALRPLSAAPTAPAASPAASARIAGVLGWIRSLVHIVGSNGRRPANGRHTRYMGYRCGFASGFVARNYHAPYSLLTRISQFGSVFHSSAGTAWSREWGQHLSVRQL